METIPRSRTAKTVAVIALILASAAALADTEYCPIDNLGMYFTGKTRSESGRLLYEYKCPRGHTTWVGQY